MGNYDKMVDSACKIFLSHNQDDILKRFPLRHDDANFFINFLGDELRVDRATGRVYLDDEEANPQVSLTVLDMICNKIGEPHPTGEWCNMSQISHASSSPGASSLFEEKIATFSGNPERLRAACETLKATPVTGGEVSYQIEVFDNVSTWLQFWDADEEFPAQMTFLWDGSITMYIHFETVWYILHEIMDRLIAVEY